MPPSSVFALLTVIECSRTAQRTLSRMHTTFGAFFARQQRVRCMGIIIIIIMHGHGQLRCVVVEASYEAHVFTVKLVQNG